MGKEVITAQDDVMSAIVKLSEGNPSAIRVMIDASARSLEIDPMGLRGPFTPLLSLDTLGIHGPRVWMLFKDVCGGRLPYFLAMLRAWQMGIVSSTMLDTAIDNRGKGLDVEATAKSVCERLDGFNLKWGEDANIDQVPKVSA